MAQLSIKQPDGGTRTTGRKAPSVLVVLVVKDGARWLRDCLRGLSQQTHPRLGVLAIDNGSTDGSHEMLTKSLGPARVMSLPENPGLPAAVQAALRSGAAEEADYVLVLHDDTVLSPDAVERLVEAAEHIDGVGVVGPKVVDWDDPRVLREVGLSTDRFGYPYSPLEEDEIDQGQYDRIREVLFVSSCAMLISRAAWRRAGMPDERLAPFHDDLDFCWRVRLSGFRVLMTPSAVAHHRLATARGEREGPGFERARYFGERSSLAAILKNYGLISLLWVLPLYFAFGLARIAGWIFSRRFEDVGLLLRAWGWNVAHLPGTLARRVRAQSVRKVPDRAVRRYMARSTERLRRWQELAGELLVGGTEVSVDLEAEEQPEVPSVGRRVVSVARGHPVAAAWVVALVVGSLAYRGLFSEGRLEGGVLAAFPSSPTGFFHELLSGYRTTGLGGAQPASPALGLLGLLSILTFGSTALAQKLVLAGLPVLAGVTFYRATLRRTGERVPAVLGAGCYALSALSLWGFSQGRIPELVALAALPSMAWRLSAAFAGDAPGRPRRFVVGWGMALGAAIAFFPGIVLSLGLLLGAEVVLPEPGARVGRGLGLALASVAAGAALALPLSLDLVRSPASLGALAGRADFAGLARLSPEPETGSWAVGWFLPAAALLSFTLALGSARRAAVRTLLISAAALYLAWFAAAGYLPHALSNPAAYLAVAAFGYCSLVATGLSVALPEMGRHAFGYRQIAVVGLSVLIAGGLVLQAGDAVVGGWDVGRDRLPAAWPLVQSAGGGNDVRVMWLGRLGGDPFPPPGGDPVGQVDAGPDSVRFGVTLRDGTSALDLGRADRGPGYAYLQRALADVLSGSTRHAGALLGPADVAFVVAAAGDLPGGALARLEGQVDLDLLPAGGLVIFRNEAVLPRAYVGSAGALSAAVRSDGPERAIAALGGLSVRPLVDVPGGYDGRATSGEVAVLADQYASGWRLAGPGRSLPPFPAFGWANAFEAPPGNVALRYSDQWIRTVEVALVALLWAGALWVTRRPAGS